MRYQSVYSISYDAPDDETAAGLARQHFNQLHDELRIDGIDDPTCFALENVIALEPTGPRSVLVAGVAREV